MKKIVVAALGLCLAGCSVGADVPAAEKAVDRFHALLDKGQTQQIYRESADEMKGATSEAKLTALLEAVHRKLGTVKKAVRKGWNDQVNTGGHFITLSYATSYTRGDAVETFNYKIADARATL